MIAERGGSIIAPNNQASACTGTPQMAPRGKELIAGGTARGKRLVRMVQQQHLVAPTLYTHMKGLPEHFDRQTHIMKLGSTVHTLNVWLDIKLTNMKIKQF